MNHFRGVGIALIALSMGFGSLASAQSREHSDRNHRSSQQHGASQRFDADQRREPRAYQAGREQWTRHAGHVGTRVDQRNDPRTAWRDQRGEWRRATHNPEFRRGGRLPDHYRHQQYRVNDWRGHYLSEPPRGYHWVQTGGDYVLAAIATGVILQILLNN